MNTTEIFQNLFKADHLHYDGKKFHNLLNIFSPGLYDQYFKICKGPMVYIWRDGVDVIYVGQSQYWHNRLAAHLIDMLAQRDFMYQHFFRAHKAKTLTVELIQCTGNLDILEEQKIIELSCPTMYNVTHNPNPPSVRFATQYVPTPLFTTPEEARAFFLKIKSDKFALAEAEWQKDPRYEVLKPRLIYDSARTPRAECEHCKDHITFTKLIKHEELCLFRFSVDKLEEIKAGYWSAQSKGKYLTQAVSDHNVSYPTLYQYCKDQ